MSDGTNQVASARLSTRRQVVAGLVVSGGCVAAGAGVLGSRVWAQGRPKETSSGANDSRTSLHQEINLKAGPQRLYEVLLTSKDFAAFSGMRADIDPKEGGPFSMFEGMIVGRNVELIRGQRIVQAWRPAAWPPGSYSIVRFELKPQGEDTRVILDHTGFPEGDFDHLSEGWHTHYWEPLTKFLS